MKSTCYILLFIFCLAGCATTLKDVQNSPPSFTLLSDLPAQKLANKIAYETAKETIENRVFRDWDPAKVVELEDGSYKLLVTFTMVNYLFMISYPPIAVADISIFPDNYGGSQLDYRGIKWAHEDKFIALIKRCASPTKATPEP